LPVRKTCLLVFRTYSKARSSCGLVTNVIDGNSRPGRLTLPVRNIACGPTGNASECLVRQLRGARRQAALFLGVFKPLEFLPKVSPPLLIITILLGLFLSWIDQDQSRHFVRTYRQRLGRTDRPRCGPRECTAVARSRFAAQYGVRWQCGLPTELCPTTPVIRRLQYQTQQPDFRCRQSTCAASVRRHRPN
jgi:hypothetical protein